MPRTHATIHAKYTVQTWQGKVPKHVTYKMNTNVNKDITKLQ